LKDMTVPSNRTRRQFLCTATMLAAGAASFRLLPFTAHAAAVPDVPAAGAVRHSDAEWRKLLSPAQYDVLRQEGTEMPFSSPLNHFYGKGQYTCAGCDHPVFASVTKFDSGTGWPSFWQPLPKGVVERQDGSLGMQRTEIHCSDCAGHLGHVFDDGPRPTGLRYCMNGVALRFKPAPGVQPPASQAS
jgi:peptide-methionine (R)-S-oxide reductase